ncbi:MAG: hypothetical protein GY850_41960 [bacterium]|nr:hypothetical protein [bacterium]
MMPRPKPCTFRYAGEYRDPLWGGYYLRARWYHPDLTTFIARLAVPPEPLRLRRWKPGHAHRSKRPQLQLGLYHEQILAVSREDIFTTEVEYGYATQTAVRGLGTRGVKECFRQFTGKDFEVVGLKTN